MLCVILLIGIGCLIWVIRDSSLDRAAAKIKEEEKEKELAAKQELYEQIDNLRDLPAILNTYKAQYIDEVCWHLARSAPPLRLFSTERITLVPYYRTEADWLKIFKTSSDKTLWKILSSTWPASQIDILKANLHKRVESSQYFETFLSSYLISELIESTRAQVNAFIRIMDASIELEETQKYNTFVQQHPEAYQLARQRDALENLTYAAQKQAAIAETAVEAMRTVAREQAHLNTTVAIAAATNIQRNYR
jgi:hypothetical protein